VKKVVVRINYFMVIEIESADELKPGRSREKCSKRGSRNREPRAFQKTKYRGKLGDISGSKEVLLL